MQARGQATHDAVERGANVVMQLDKTTKMVLDRAAGEQGGEGSVQVCVCALVLVLFE